MYKNGPEVEHYAQQQQSPGCLKVSRFFPPLLSASCYYSSREDSIQTCWDVCISFFCRSYYMISSSVICMYFFFWILSAKTVICIQHTKRGHSRDGERPVDQRPCLSFEVGRGSVALESVLACIRSIWAPEGCCLFSIPIVYSVPVLFFEETAGENKTNRRESSPSNGSCLLCGLPARARLAIGV